MFAWFQSDGTFPDVKDLVKILSSISAQMSDFSLSIFLLMLSGSIALFGCMPCRS